MRSCRQDLESRGSGLVLRSIAGGWRLYTHPDTAPVVEQFVLSSRQARLTKAALEDARHRRLQAAGDASPGQRVRGVNSDGVLLADRGLIEEVGRDEAPGRPVLFATTPGFLERLGLPSLASLPSLAPLLGVDDATVEDGEVADRAVDADVAALERQNDADPQP